MKANVCSTPAALIFTAISVCGQGSFVYDQQSSTDETPPPFGFGQSIQPTIIGQSFTPSLSSVGFIRLRLSDGNPNDDLGTSLYLNLRANSIVGPILDSASAAILPNRFAGTVNFLFTKVVPVTPGLKYYFDLVVQPGGGPFGIVLGESTYSGGEGFGNGVPNPASDLWFREGIVVPEPPVWALLTVGAGLFFWPRKR